MFVAESIPAFIIYIGVSGLIILVVMIISIIILCQKQGNKKIPPESKFFVVLLTYFNYAKGKILTTLSSKGLL